MTYQTPVTLILTACLLLAGSGCSSDKAALKSSVSPPVLAIASSRQPLELISGDGQLGSIDFGEQTTCTFRLRNNLTQPMTIKLVDKSCTCAAVQMPSAPIEPGQETSITMTWAPKAEVLETNTVRLWAEIASSTGQHRLRLESTGTIEPKLQIAFPRGPLDLGKITPADIDEEQTKLVVEVYSRQQEFTRPESKFNTQGLKIQSTDTLSSDRLLALQAKSGYRLTIKPNRDLPHGSILAQLAIHTTLKPEPLQLEIIGNLETSAISLSPDRLQLPPKLSLSTGYRIPSITITSRFGTLTKCEVVTITPNLFEVKLHQVNDKTWKLDVSLSNDSSKLQQRFSPKDWQQLQDFGFDQGSITLRLDHSDVKSLTIPITGTQLNRE